MSFGNGFTKIGYSVHNSTNNITPDSGTKFKSNQYVFDLSCMLYSNTRRLNILRLCSCSG